MGHFFTDIPIKTQEKDFISYFAKEYIKQRTGKNSDIINSPILANSGFNNKHLQKIIQNSSVKKDLNLNNGKLNPKDLYRSELGEMLMTSYFEKKLSENERFKIPVKLITDKETAEMPSRGLDCIGFRKDGDKIHLLIGEAKVSDEKKAPPQVVKQIYDTQFELKNKDVLVSKLSDFSKKLSGEHYTIILFLIGFIEFNKNNNYSITFGCALIRDKDCIDTASDFGKMRTNQSEFDPHNIHFVIMWFQDQIIEETVFQFFDEVQKQVNS